MTDFYEQRDVVINEFEKLIAMKDECNKNEIDLLQRKVNILNDKLHEAYTKPCKHVKYTFERVEGGLNCACLCCGKILANYANYVDAQEKGISEGFVQIEKKDRFLSEFKDLCAKYGVESEYPGGVHPSIYINNDESILTDMVECISKDDDR